MKILLTEDNKVSRQLALLIFGQLGYHVDIATNGEDAIRLWQEHHYDIIFMDIMMPGMNGYDATRMIRSFEQDNGGDKHTIIIAITAKQKKGEYDEAVASGMDDYLTKPVTEKLIGDAIKKWYKPEKSTDNSNKTVKTWKHGA
jgi:CheY-like chemotaxis protein